METNNNRRGFSLLEILVALAVLTLVVLMMSQVFQQSSSVWQGAAYSNGLDMSARGVVSQIQADLERAVPAANFTNHTGGAGNVEHSFETSSAVFIVLADKDGQQRAPRVIKYTWNGSKVMRGEAPLVEQPGTGTAPFERWIMPSPTSYKEKELEGSMDYARIAGFKFVVRHDAPPNEQRWQLPASLDIEMSVEFTGQDYKTFAARSWGPKNAEKNPDKAIYVGEGKR